jgi:LysR family transcriptional regulator of gallate degradation
MQPAARDATPSRPSTKAHQSDNTPPLIAHLRALRALLAVVSHGSTVAAAQAIHLSQPAITRAINRLEEVCAQPLFLRTSRGMQATAQGRQLARRAGLLFAHLKTGAQEAIALATSSDTRPRPHAVDRFPQSVSSSQIRALIAVAACGSETQAALQLGISQPAVYAALQELEHLLAVSLFYKLPSGTRLTPPGEALLLRAKQAVAELRGMASDIAAWHGETRGRIVIGVLPLSVPIFLPRVTQTLMTRYPAVQLSIIDGTYENLMQRLLSAEIDAIAGALRKQLPHAEVLQHDLFDDELVIIASRDHPCLQRSQLSLQDLLQWSWVTPLPDTPADRVMRAIFAQAGLPSPSPRLSVGSPLMTLALVLQSGLLAITSRGQVLLDDHGGAIRIVPLDLPSSARQIGITTRATTVPTPDLQAFIEICKESVADLTELALDLPGSSPHRCEPAALIGADDLRRTPSLEGHQDERTFRSGLEPIAIRSVSGES